MHINFQVFLSYAWLTQLVYLRKQWRKRSRREQTSASNTSQLKKCSQRKSWWILRQPSRQCPWEKPSSTLRAWKPCLPICRSTLQMINYKSCSRLAERATKKTSSPSNFSPGQWHFSWKRTPIKYRRARSRMLIKISKHTMEMKSIRKKWIKRRWRTWCSSNNSSNSKSMQSSMDRRMKMTAKGTVKIKTTMSMMPRLLHNNNTNER